MPLTDEAREAMITGFITNDHNEVNNEATYFIALHTSSSPSSGNEVSGNGYLRGVDVEFEKRGGQRNVAQNPDDIVFPAASASWGTVRGVSIQSHVTNWLPVATGVVSSPLGVNSGDTVTIDAEGITITIQ